MFEFPEFAVTFELRKKEGENVLSYPVYDLFRRKELLVDERLHLEKVDLYLLQWLIYRIDFIVENLF